MNSLSNVFKSNSSQILNGAARYALVNAIADSFLQFEMSCALYVGGFLLRSGALTVQQFYRCVFYYLKVTITKATYYLFDQ